jgi:mannose-6-phosphate isomerase-like protein (cupin superfamily)
MAGLGVAAPKEGEALWFLDTLMQIKLSSADTGGALAILEQVAPSGSATPMHRHDHTDEYFYVLQGEVTFFGDTRSERCAAGSFVTVPKGTPHAFRVTSKQEAKLLVISAPGRFEQFVRAVSRPAPQVGLPPAAPPPTPEAMQELAAIGSQNDTVLVGPPPVGT